MNSVFLTSSLLRRGAVLLLGCVAVSMLQAQIETISFSASVFSSNLASAGSVVTGTLQFDLGAASLPPSAPANHFGVWTFAQPASFTFSTNGGFSLTQNLTALNVADKFRNGITDYYVFDADLGTYGVTPFSRLELGFSNNSNPIIPNLDIPQSLALGDFQFKTALYYGYDAQGNLTQRIASSVNSVEVSVIPEPSTYAALTGLAALGFVVLRRRERRAMI